MKWSGILEICKGLTQFKSSIEKTQYVMAALSIYILTITRNQCNCLDKKSSELLNKCVHVGG